MALLPPPSVEREGKRALRGDEQDKDLLLGSSAMQKGSQVLAQFQAPPVGNTHTPLSPLLSPILHLRRCSKVSVGGSPPAFTLLHNNSTEPRESCGHLDLAAQGLGLSGCKYNSYAESLLRTLDIKYPRLSPSTYSSQMYLT